MDVVYSTVVTFVQVIVYFGSIIALLHLIVMTATGVKKGDFPNQNADHPWDYAFMVPCLNEELVIASTIERLLKYPDNAMIYVIDDGSDDATAAIVQAYAQKSARVRLLHRELPAARQGKGEALNACYQQIVKDYTGQGVDPNHVIVCVMDADGLLDGNALTAIEGLFGNPEVGAAQVVVRVSNRETFRGRLQDMDFFMFCNIMQQGRNHIGSVGLGGNGQFTRLSALMSLGPRPWTECLTEDLDLGLQLVVKGWRLAFTRRTAVHQQGLVNLAKLLRQRTRWVQGHFQCWRRVPQVLRMRGKWYAKADLVYYLTWPAISCLVFPLALLASWVLFALQITSVATADWRWGLIGLVGYFLAFGPNIMLAFVYRSISGDISPIRTFALAHLMSVYQFIWLIAGWRGVTRNVVGRRGWAKTERVTVRSEPNDLAI